MKQSSNASHTTGKQAAANSVSKGAMLQFSNPQPILQQMADRSPQVAQGSQVQQMANAHMKQQISRGSLSDQNPLQLKLQQGATYTVNQAEPGRKRNQNGSVAAQPGPETTVVGQIYLVVGFRTQSQVEYMQLKPLGTNAPNFYVPVGNDGYYALEPSLDNSTNWEENPPTQVTGNAYNGQAPNATDITQGAIGDCWLIAPMMALTMSNYWNQHVANLVANQGQGYQVTLGNPANIDSGQGNPTQVVTVSGWIPTVPQAASASNQNDFLYAQYNKGLPDQINGQHGQNQAAVWPALVEKAAAKSFGGGSYQGLDNNNADVGFKLLGHSGPQTLNNPNGNSQEYANMILAMQNNAAGTATTKMDDPHGTRLSTDPDDQQQMAAAYLGLIEDHVYIILGTSTLQGLKLKNPHGAHEPTGDIPQANVQDAIARIDYLPVPPPPQQQPPQQIQVPVQQPPQQNLQQQPHIQPPQQQAQAQALPQPNQQQQPPVVIQQVAQVVQQAQQHLQQAQQQAQQQLQPHPPQIQVQIQPHIQLLQQQFHQIFQQQVQNAQHQQPGPIVPLPQQLVQIQQAQQQNQAPNPRKRRKLNP